MEGRLEVMLTAAVLLLQLGPLLFTHHARGSRLQSPWNIQQRKNLHFFLQENKPNIGKKKEGNLGRICNQLWLLGSLSRLKNTCELFSAFTSWQEPIKTIKSNHEEIS